VWGLASVSAPRWFLIVGGVPVSSCAASDVRSAREALGWRVGDAGFVQSAASYSIPTRKAEGRPCARCQRAERVGGRSYCAPCNSIVTYAGEQARKVGMTPEEWLAQRKAGRGKGVRGPDKRERRSPTRPAEHRAKIAASMREVQARKRAGQ
jgi:hypothetical protein